MYPVRANWRVIPPAAGIDVWHVGELAHQAKACCVPTGASALDAQLPGGGWPVGAIVEILQAQAGRHEWRLLLPALVQTSGPVVLVGAPHIPFAPGLAAQGLDSDRLLWIAAATPAERLWAAEQALRCAEVAVVLAWLPQARPEPLRRLQIAAADHAKLLFVMRPWAARDESSPAVLRLLLGSGNAASNDAPADALMLEILKRRGPPLAQPLSLLARGARLAALLAAARANKAARRRQLDEVLRARIPPLPVSSRETVHALDRLAGAAR